MPDPTEINEEPFEEGLKDAQAVILVLSRFSVEKPWVREELNAATTPEREPLRVAA